MTLIQRQTTRTVRTSSPVPVRQGVVNVVGAGALALTLPPPTKVDEGSILIITAGSAHAHTVTYSAGFNGAGASADVATFGGAIGDNIMLVAVSGVWRVVSVRNVTLA